MSLSVCPCVVPCNLVRHVFQKYTVWLPNRTTGECTG
ncbi:unnamed protein product, partial [Staurois parvus]